VKSKVRSRSKVKGSRVSRGILPISYFIRRVPRLLLQSVPSFNETRGNITVHKSNMIFSKSDKNFLASAVNLAVMLS